MQGYGPSLHCPHPPSRCQTRGLRHQGEGTFPLTNITFCMFCIPAFCLLLHHKEQSRHVSKRIWPADSHACRPELSARALLRQQSLHQLRDLEVQTESTGRLQSDETARDARLSRFAAALPLQDRHKRALVQQSVERNMESRNFG